MIAFSFPCWTCRDCRQVVEWADAVAVLDGEKCDGFRHSSCAEVAA